MPPDQIVFKVLLKHEQFCLPILALPSFEIDLKALVRQLQPRHLTAPHQDRAL